MYTAARVLASVGAERGDSYTWDVMFGRPVLLPSTVSVRVAHPDDDAPSSGSAKSTRSPANRPRFDLAVWDPRSGKPHLTGTVTPIG